MKQGIITISMILLFCFGTVGTAKATVLDFENTGYEYQGSMPIGNLQGSGYGDFNWSYYFKVYYGPALSPGYDVGTVSGDYAAFNQKHNDVLISSDSLFDWSGAWFNGPINNAEDSLITLKGLSGGQEVVGYEIDIELDYSNPTWIQADWTGIDEISFDSHGAYFTMDDFTYFQQVAIEPAPEPVPEPTTVALLGLGLVGLAGVDVRRRLRKKVVDKS